MSCASMLQTALTPIGLPVYPNRYTGPELEYIVTNYSTVPAVHADGIAHAARYLIQVHYYLPEKQNPNSVLEQICKALEAADCTCPDVFPEMSGGYYAPAKSHGQHYVLECEYCDGGIAYGEA